MGVPYCIFNWYIKIVINSLFITADEVGIQTGGGIVTNNEYLALKSFSNVDVLQRSDIMPPQNADNPFMIDSTALNKVTNLKPHLTHFYAGTFSNTIKKLKENGSKISYTAAAHDRKTSIEEFNNLGYNYPWEHMSNDKIFELYVNGYKEADLLICPSTLSAKVMRSYGCTNEIVVIPHGVHIPTETTKIPNKFTVGYLGQIGPDKGIIYLIKAWRQLNYTDAKLVFAGRSSIDLLPSIRSEGRGQIQLLGFVKSISELYNMTSIYVQPSVCEGFGIEVLEAMAYGRPVIVADGAGAADVVTDGIDGFVVPKRNPSAIADKINWFYNNQHKIIDMGNMAREKALNYEWADIRRKYVDQWSKLLNVSTSI
jgi:glycosyltransferase involved in cell wall biosynthesis